MIRLIFILSLFVCRMVEGQESVAAGVKVISNKNPDCSSVESIIKSIIKPGMSDQEKTEAIFNFLVYRLYHYSCPQEPLSYSLKNRVAASENSMVMDTVKNLNIYGHAICGSMSWYVNELANAAGLMGRINGVSGHTVPEIKYGGSWHYIDVDMMGFVRKVDGTLPSVDEIKADKNLLFAKHDKQPEIFFKFDGAPGMWECLNEGVKFSMYGRKVGVHSMNVTLREGETFARYFKRQWAPQYQFYVGSWKNDYLSTIITKKGSVEGPAKAETYYLYKEKDMARFGNFELLYEAPIAVKDCVDACYRVGNIQYNQSKKVFESLKSSSESEIVYKFYSPYGCAGVPGDLHKNEDNKEGMVLDGEFLNENGEVLLSLDLGHSWTSIYKSGGQFHLDVTPLVESRYCWLVKLIFKGEGSGLKSFKSKIRGQLSPAALPYVDGKTEMTFSRDQTDCLALLPDIGDGIETVKREAFAIENFDSYDEKKGNIGFKGMKGAVIYRVEAPADIVRVQTGAKFSRNRGAFYSVSFSLDEGKSWVIACKQRVVDEDEDHPDEFWGQSIEGVLDFETKRAYSPGCIPGDGSIKENTFESKPTRAILVKFETTKGWLIQVHGIYVHYKKAGSLPLVITHEWEGGKHQEKILANENSKNYSVVGNKISDNTAIIISAPIQK